MPAFSFNLNDFVFVWWALLYEALPFVIIGSVVSGLVERCLSRETVVRLMPKNRLLGILTGGVLGLAFPMCECGIVPVVRRLMLKGVPVSCGIAYMLAAPIVNPLVIASTMFAFYKRGAVVVTALRVGLGFAIAVVAAAAVWRILGERNVLLAGDAPEHDHHFTGSVLGDALRIAGEDFMTFAVQLVLGSGVAALINSGFSRSAIEPIAESPYAAAPGMMGLAVLLNLCSEADAFVAASFRAFPLPAKMAFLVYGPMVDLKLLVMFTTVFRPRAIAFIVGVVTALCLAACVSGYWWMPLYSIG